MVTSTVFNGRPSHTAKTKKKVDLAYPCMLKTNETRISLVNRSPGHGFPTG